MARNQYIDNYNSANEQKLIEDLVVESIKFYGHDTYYLPRNGTNIDVVFNEFEYSTFDRNFELEVYVKNVNSFGGDGQFMSKFGLEVRDQITLTISVRSFTEFVGEPGNLPRPREGDLIYVPFLAAAYEIRFVETAGIFFQMGKIQSYDLTCEVFEYSNETFNTGIEEIDAIYAVHLRTANTVTTLDNEEYKQNDEFQNVADPIMDWSDQNPFGDF